MNCTLIRISAILVAVGLSACSPKVNDSVSTNPHTTIPFVSNTWINSNYSGLFQAHRVEEVSSVGSIVNTEVDANLYLDSASVCVNGGSLSLNGGAVGTTDYSGSGGGYIYHSSTLEGAAVPVSFTGNQQKISLAGGPGFPGIEDSVASPQGVMAITAPGTSATISKSTGYTVQWAHTGTANNIVINIIDTSGTGSVQKITTDAGTYSFSSSDLSSLTPGPLKVGVTRITYKQVTDTYGRQYVIAIWTTEIIHCTLTS